MDFIADQLFNGSRFRVLTVVDNYSKKSQGLYADRQIKGADVVEFMNHLKRSEGGVPERILVDNGSGFISKELELGL
ncbi:MAG: transposase family protein [Chlorobiaceae bacterium]|nr:transposase family protein [Chlorobiaceae bacterium]